MTVESAERDAEAEVARVAPIARGPRRVTHWPALAALAAGLLLPSLFGRIASDVARSVTHTHGDSPTVFVAAMLASQLALIAVALVTPLVAAGSLTEALDLRPANWRVFAWAAAGTVLLGPLGDCLMTAFSALFPRLTLGVVPLLRELAQQLPMLVLWPTFALFPGLSEELLFRGVLQGALRDPRWAVVVSGVVFALFHVDPVHVVGVLPLGLFLAFAAQRGGTLVTIVAHVANNSVALIGIRVSELDVGFGSSQPMPWSVVVTSLLLFVATLALLVRDTRALR